MALTGEFIIVPPEQWLFANHGDVVEAKRRAGEWFGAKGSFEGAERVIEEFVRQWILKRLVDAYKYPREWLGERIIIEEPVEMGSTEKEGELCT